MKYNIDYYPHKTGAHGHWKFKQLRRKFGWAGEGRFWALNNMVANADGCLLNIADQPIKEEAAADLDMNTEELDDFIKFLVENVRLLFLTDGYIGSQTTQETLEGLSGKRNYQREWKRSKSNIDSSKSIDEKPKSIIENGKTNIDFEQSKVNKKKVNKKKEIDGYAPSPKPPSITEVKIQRRQEREDIFYKSLVPFVVDYGKEMLREFYDYWSEPNKSGTKMKWEMERTWDLKRRLAKWQANNDKWNKDKPNAKNEHEESAGTDSRILEKIKQSTALS
ncbi:MAG: Lin1244/Lin1753 domain-containing protein [Taibaiella sp.]|jgi:hypothetical protein